MTGPGHSVKEKLFSEFYNFSFFQAVNMLERLYPGKKGLDQSLSPTQEAVRFSVKPGFAFPASEISSLRKGDEQGSPAEMEVAFMGLVGPSGVLPNWYNEMAIERAKEKDTSQIAFYNMFHHRLISLFYLAWKRNRLTAHKLSGNRDRVSGYLLSLMGLGTAGLVERVSRQGEAPIFYSGLLSRQIPSVAAISSAVEYFFGVNANIEQFVGRVIILDREDRSSIGKANSQLGVNAVCGSQVWENQSKFCVNLGPMGLKQFVSLLPSGGELRSIFALVKYMAGIEFEFDVRLILRREEVPACQLGAGSPLSARLGWTTWIKSPGTLLGSDPRVTFREADVVC